MDTVSDSLPDPVVIIHRYIAMLQDKGLAPTTREAYLNDLLSLNTTLTEQDVHLLKATTKNIADYIQDRVAQGAEPTSIARYITSMKGFFKFLIESRLVSIGPLIPARPVWRKLPFHSWYFLTPEELGALFKEEWPPGPLGKRNCLILKVIAQTRLKSSEVAALTIGDIDFATGKGPIIQRRKQRIQVIFDEDLRKEIKEYMTSDRKEIFYSMAEGDYLFPAAHGGCLSRQSIWHILRHYRMNVGIRKISVHDLHRSYLYNAT